MGADEPSYIIKCFENEKILLFQIIFCILTLSDSLPIPLKQTLSNLPSDQPCKLCQKNEINSHFH